MRHSRETEGGVVTWDDRPEEWMLTTVYEVTMWPSLDPTREVRWLFPYYADAAASLSAVGFVRPAPENRRVFYRAEDQLHAMLEERTLRTGANAIYWPIKRPFTSKEKA